MSRTDASRTLSLPSRRESFSRSSVSKEGVFVHPIEAYGQPSVSLLAEVREIRSVLTPLAPLFRLTNWVISAWL
jgi:hypothetical protein